MKSDFVKGLEKEDEVRITVRGRRTGREISLPVWFVLEGNTVYLLPVEGSSTNWFLNLKKDPQLGLSVGKKPIKFRAQLLYDKSSVEEAVRRFEGRYGKDEITRWYSKLDACVLLNLSS